MLKIGIYFRQNDNSSAIYLPGISKRLSALGLQPVAHDKFRIEDFNTKDQQLITEACGSAVDIVEVCDRVLSFGIKFSVLNIYLEMVPRDKDMLDHEMFNGREQIA
jgi:hypothetical protein